MVLFAIECGLDCGRNRVRGYAPSRHGMVFVDMCFITVHLPVAPG